MSDPQLESIKARWEEENRYHMLDLPSYRIFDDAQKDTSYLLNRLEAAEKAARGIAKMHGHKIDQNEND